MGIAKFDEQALRNFASVLASILTHGKITEMLARVIYHKQRAPINLIGYTML